MGLATDQAGIQFRVLNSRKGPAVRATRAQADGTLSRERRFDESSKAPPSTGRPRNGRDLVINDSVIAGVVTHAGHTFKAPAGVLTTGAFLGGGLFVGQESPPGGAPLEARGRGRSPRNFVRSRFESIDLKREHRRELRTSVDFDRMEVQLGTNRARPCHFCPHQTTIPVKRVANHLHESETHDIIRAGLHRSPCIPGRLKEWGPDTAHRSKKSGPICRALSASDICKTRERP
ncbi:MAG: hypothetical protein CM1200mP9_00280 [Gammaproteobacteria bacterium]|nr:MAG: hypothetical protein CM1200mP9_00280 [Gammaproteobacteria bacterium]